MGLLSALTTRSLGPSAAFRAAPAAPAAHLLTQFMMAMAVRFYAHPCGGVYSGAHLKD